MHKAKLLSLILFIVLLCSCSNNKQKTFENGYLGTIMFKPDSNETEVFKELGIGNLMHFSFTINDEEHTWIDYSIELYKKGDLTPQVLGGIGTGRGISNDPVSDPMYVMHMTDHHTKEHFFKVTVGGSSFFSSKIPPFNREDGTPLGYMMQETVGTKAMDLIDGEEYIIGYMFFNTQFRTYYDVLDEQMFNELLTENDFVILFKMKPTKIVQ